MIAEADPSALGSVSDAVESLDSAVEFVALFVEGCARLNLEVSSKVPLATLGVGCDLLPDSLLLGGAWEGQVLGSFGGPVVVSLMFH